MTVSKEWLDTEIAERSKEPHRTMYSRTLLDALKELASRRAADEGAVTVEGFVRQMWEDNPAFCVTELASEPDDTLDTRVEVRIKEAKP